MTASPWACVLLDHASTNALTTGVTAKHVNRSPSTAERTSSLSRGLQASNCPIGLCGATIVGFVQGRACGVEGRRACEEPTAHLQKIENSR
jgi:hypothetical protein